MAVLQVRERAPLSARWRASGWDYLAIVGWLVLLTALGAVVRAVAGPAPRAAPPRPVAADGVAFALTVLPVWAYLTVGEAGRTGASWGKRRAGLRVVGPGGARPGPGRVAVRNAVKLLPWQLAHVAVARMILEVDQSATITVTYASSLLVVVATIGMASRDPLRRALHDRVAGTRVVLA